MQREGDRRRGRALARQGEKVAIATVVATRRSAPRPIGAKFAVSVSGRDVRLGLGRLRRERHRRAGPGGDRVGRAAAAQLRDHRRPGVGRRAAVRRRDRRLSRASGLTLFTETLLALARGTERAVVFTVVAGERELGRKLIVLRRPGRGRRGRRARPGGAGRRAPAQRHARARRPDDLRGRLRAAAAPRRGRRGRHRRGALRARQVGRLADDLRRCPCPVRHPGARPECGRDRRRVARRGVRADPARPRHGRGRPDARRQVRHPGPRRSTRAARRSTSAHSAAGAPRRTGASGCGRRA